MQMKTCRVQNRRVQNRHVKNGCVKNGCVKKAGRGRKRGERSSSYPGVADTCRGVRRDEAVRGCR
jgi:hypothetical protein